ncbi:MAG: hypothetical protein R3F59_20565 [Myxococcota bacterium]
MPQVERQRAAAGERADRGGAARGVGQVDRGERAQVERGERVDGVGGDPARQVGRRVGIVVLHGGELLLLVVPVVVDGPAQAEGGEEPRVEERQPGAQRGEPVGVPGQGEPGDEPVLPHKLGAVGQAGRPGVAVGVDEGVGVALQGGGVGRGARGLAPLQQRDQRAADVAAIAEPVAVDPPGGAVVGLSPQAGLELGVGQAASWQDAPVTGPCPGARVASYRDVAATCPGPR